MTHPFLWAFIFISFVGNAQSISMEFPAFAGQTYDFVIFQGSKSATVIQDTIPSDGKFVLTVPKQYAPYTGMSRWLITNSEFGGGLDMAIPGHDFAISCLSAQPNEENIIYTGFDAVNELNRLYGLQQSIMDKFETMSRATQLYDKNHPLYATFQEEKRLQAKAYENFQQDLKNNSNYNARFLPIVNLIQGIPHRLTDDYNEKALLFNEYITQKVSFDDLYVSGHWDGIIQSWVMLQTNVVDDKNKFAEDFKTISDRIKNKNHYTDFTGKITFYLTQYGKDDYIDAIANTVLESGKVNEYAGSMQVYLKARVGKQAPDLEITEHLGKFEDHIHQTRVLKSKDLAKGKGHRTLLVFYQSGCGPCEETMQGLIGNYAYLASKKMKIVSISSDTDEQVFKNTSTQFPWKDSYCDFKGIQGVTFKNYAVSGTPTLFVLDSKGTIITKLSSYTAVLDWVQKN